MDEYDKQYPIDGIGVDGEMYEDMYYYEQLQNNEQMM